MPLQNGTNVVWPGSPYNGLPLLTVMTQLNNAAANPATRAQAVTDLQALGNLPQFHGIGWQGLVAMLGIIGGGALTAALSGAGATGAGTSLAAIQGGAVPEIPLGATAAGTAGTAGLASPALAGIGGSSVASSGLLGGLGISNKQLLTAGLGALGGALEN